VDAMLEVRLLELEQKFESYRAIHKEELKEIKATLDQLREDILRNNHDHITGLPKKNPAAVSIPTTSHENSGRKA
jgi:predicted phage gp36 major capsid-like protein